MSSEETNKLCEGSETWNGTIVLTEVLVLCIVTPLQLTLAVYFVFKLSQTKGKWMNPMVTSVVCIPILRSYTFRTFVL